MLQRRAGRQRLYPSGYRELASDGPRRLFQRNGGPLRFKKGSGASDCELLAAGFATLTPLQASFGAPLAGSGLDALLR